MSSWMSSGPLMQRALQMQLHEDLNKRFDKSCTLLPLFLRPSNHSVSKLEVLAPIHVSLMSKSQVSCGDPGLVSVIVNRVRPQTLIQSHNKIPPARGQ
jgi:hypothetical protein